MIFDEYSQMKYVNNGNMGCEVFKRGIKKIERFLPKNQNTQSQSIMSKIIRPFSWKNLGAHFLLLTFFEKLLFKAHFCQLISEFW